MAVITPRPATVETICTLDGLETLAPQWDALVRAMPRPSPFMLHGWLAEWWRHHGDGLELAVHAARRDGELVAALPLVVRKRAGLRVASFMGDRVSVLPDLLLARGADLSVAAPLIERLSSAGSPPGAGPPPPGPRPADRAALLARLRRRRLPRPAGRQPHRERARLPPRGDPARRVAGPEPRARLGHGLQGVDERQEAQSPQAPPAPAVRARRADGHSGARAARARARARGGVPAARAALGGSAGRLGLRHSRRHGVPPRRPQAAGGERRRAHRDATARRPRDRLSLLVRARGLHVRAPARLRPRTGALVARAREHARRHPVGGRRGHDARRVPRWRRALQARARRRLVAAVPRLRPQLRRPRPRLRRRPPRDDQDPAAAQAVAAPAPLLLRGPGARATARTARARR